VLGSQGIVVKCTAAIFFPRWIKAGYFSGVQLLKGIKGKQKINAEMNYMVNFLL